MPPLELLSGIGLPRSDGNVLSATTARVNGLISFVKKESAILSIGTVSCSAEPLLSPSVLPRRLLKTLKFKK